MEKSESKIVEVGRKRKINKDRKAISSRGSKTICLPEREDAYTKIIDSPKEYRNWLDLQYVVHPQLFPIGMEGGYFLHDILYSKKEEDISRRRIKLKKDGSCYAIRPSYVLPYMVGRTSEVEKALYFAMFQAISLSAEASAF